MTIDEVRNQVAAIDAVKSDNEVAHIKEDYLYVAVLRAIADGAPDAAALAAEALRADAIKFCRWHA